MLFRSLVSAALIAASSLTAIHSAEPSPAPVKPKITVTPNAKDWLSAVGDPVTFRLVVTPAGDEPSTVRYRLGPEQFEPEVPARASVPPDGLEIEAGTLSTPGFLRLIATKQVGNQKLRGLATIGFSPERIEPTQSNPGDFDAFWHESLEKLATVPMDPILTPKPELSGEAFDAFELSFGNYDPNGRTPRFYGILCVPKKPGRYPAVLQTPGAGVRGYKGEIWLPRDRFITLEVGIHGIPVTEPADFYSKLAAGELAGYERRNLADRDLFYYRRVYLGCYRAVDYLAAHEKWDGKNLVVRGGSQGGQLAIVTAALHPRVTGFAAAFPAFCDVTGYLHGRAGGWPGLFREAAGDPLRREKEVAVTAYYDVVNFARRLKVPGYFTWGFNDEVCPPTSFYAMYNVVTSPKSLNVFPPAGHDLPPEGWGKYTEATIQLATQH